MYILSLFFYLVNMIH